MRTFLLAVLTVFTISSAAAQVTVITHATVIDGTGTPPQADTTSNVTEMITTATTNANEPSRTRDTE